MKRMLFATALLAGAVVVPGRASATTAPTLIVSAWPQGAPWAQDVLVPGHPEVVRGEARGIDVPPPIEINLGISGLVGVVSSPPICHFAGGRASYTAVMQVPSNVARVIARSGASAAYALMGVQYGGGSCGGPTSVVPAYNLAFLSPNVPLRLASSVPASASTTTTTVPATTTTTAPTTTTVPPTTTAKPAPRRHHGSGLPLLPLVVVVGAGGIVAAALSRRKPSRR